MKQILVFALMLIFASCTKQAKPENGFATNKGKGHNQFEAITQGTTATITLTNNGGGNFSIDYGGATDFVSAYFRAGNELSSPSSNVIPLGGTMYFLTPVTSFQSTITGTFYQIVVVTGSKERVDGVVYGSGWVMNYSNVVQ